MKIQTALLFFLLFSFSTLNGASKRIIGEVKQIDGKAYCEDLETGKKVLLRLKDKITEDVIIITEKKSRVVIEFMNKKIKVIPENSKSKILNKKYLESLEKSENGVDNLSEIIGIRAKDLSEDHWQDDLEKIKEEFLNAFREKNYLKAISLYEKNKNAFDTSELIYLTAVVFLKTGLEEIAVQRFQKLLLVKNSSFEKPAYFGLFIAYFRLNDLEKARETLILIEKADPNGEFLKMAEKILLTQEK